MSELRIGAIGAWAGWIIGAINALLVAKSGTDGLLFMIGFSIIGFAVAVASFGK